MRIGHHQEAAIGREPNAAGVDVLKDQLESPLNDGQFVALHPALERALRISAPEYRERAPSNDK